MFDWLEQTQDGFNFWRIVGEECKCVLQKGNFKAIRQKNVGFGQQQLENVQRGE